MIKLPKGCFEEEKVHLAKAKRLGHYLGPELLNVYEERSSKTHQIQGAQFFPNGFLKTKYTYL